MFKFILGAVLVSVSPAVFAAQSDVREERVQYSDLNLASPEGQATLHRRLSRAVKVVCAEPGDNTIDAAKRASKCQRETMAHVRIAEALVVARAQDRQGASQAIAVR